MEEKDIIYENINFSNITNVRFSTFMDKGDYAPNHWHRAIEIMYVIEGELIIYLEQKTMVIKQGQCILINANVIHAKKSIANNKFILLQIPIDFMSKYINIQQMIFSLNDGLEDKFKQQKINNIKNLLLKMEKLNNSDEEGKLLGFNQLLFRVLGILQRYFSVKVYDTDIGQKNKDLARLNIILAYIMQHYRENISLEKIAQVAIFQPKYFCRFFKKHMGISFLMYQNELRISFIYRDLINSNDSINTILERHGFSNYKLFMRMFKEKFGDTPSNIRKQLKQSNK